MTEVLEWLGESTSPSRWHLVLLWLVILVCLGWEMAFAEPLLSVLHP